MLSPFIYTAVARLSYLLLAVDYPQFHGLSHLYVCDTAAALETKCNTQKNEQHKI